MGTAKECAIYLGVKENTIRFYSSAVYHKRIKNSNESIYAIVVEEDCEGRKMDGEKIKVAEAYLRSVPNEKILTFEVVEEIKDFGFDVSTLKEQKEVIGYWLTNERNEKVCYFRNFMRLYLRLKKVGGKILK